MRRILTFAAAVSLGVTALDAGIAMVPWSDHWRTAGAALRVTPLVLAAAFAGFLVVAGVLSLCGRFLKRSPESLFGAAGVACLLGFGLLRYFDLLTRSALLGPNQWKSLLAFGAGLIVFYLLYRWTPSFARLESVGLVVAAATVVLWVFVYGLRDSHSVLRWAVLCVGLLVGFELWRRTANWSGSRTAALAMSLWAAALAVGWLAAEHPSSYFQHVSDPALTPPQGVPPILLLSIDTLRKDSLSFYNPSADPTPNLDALARDSVVFNNAMSAASWTLPSVTSFMTGLAAREHGRSTKDWRLPENLPRLAQSLSAAGYRTAAAVDNGWLRPAAGFADGFHSYAHLPRFAESVGSRAEHNLGLDSTQTLTWLAREWISGHQDEPFFFWLHYLDPHGPYAPPRDLRPPGPPPPGLGWSFGNLAHHRHFRALREAPGYRPPPAEEIAWYRGLYDAEVRHVDREVGKLMGTLRDAGLYDRMLIVFLSDHGEEFWEHEDWGHGRSTFDETVSVPLAVKLPRAVEGQRVEAPVSTRRVHHTILDFAGLQADPCAQDASLARVWNRVADSAEVADELGVLVSSRKHEDGQEDALVFAGRKVVRNADTGDIHFFDRLLDRREQNPLNPSEEDQAALQERFELYRQRADYRRRCLGIGQNESSGEFDQRAVDKLRDLGYIQ